MRTHWLLAFFTSIIALSALVPAGALHGRSGPLSGAWVLNVAASDATPDGDSATSTLVITLGADTVTFYLSDGSRRVYHLSGRRERQDLGSGPVWTRARWDGTTLRLNIEGERHLVIHQSFALDRRTRQLIVVTSPDERRLPMHAVRLVYDPLIDRER
jgi:hypothetical protein